MRIDGYYGGIYFETYRLKSFTERKLTKPRGLTYCIQTYGRYCYQEFKSYKKSKAKEYS